jgi:hypothetical protein
MKKNILGLLAATAFLGGSTNGPDPFGPVVPKGKAPVPPELNPDLLHTNADWIPWREFRIGAMDEENTVSRIRIDTRDYCGIAHYGPLPAHKLPDLHKTRKYPSRYFHTDAQMIALLERFEEESRYGPEPDDHTPLILEGIFRTQNWELKYTTLYRFEQGWIVCGDQGRDSVFVFNKSDLAAPIFQGRRSKR